MNAHLSDICFRKLDNCAQHHARGLLQNSFNVKSVEIVLGNNIQSLAAKTLYHQ